MLQDAEVKSDFVLRYQSLYLLFSVTLERPLLLCCLLAMMLCTHT